MLFLHGKRVCYLKKMTAKHAAAARALDVLRFEKDGTLEPRICDEDPLDDGKSSGEEEEDDEEEDDEDGEEDI